MGQTKARHRESGPNSKSFLSFPWTIVTPGDLFGAAAWQAALLLFSTALELGFLQEFPFLSQAAKGTCCICNQKKNPQPWAEAIPPRSIWLIAPLHRFHHLQNKTSACLCSAFLTNKK